MNKIYRLLLANLKEVMRNKAALFWTFLFPIIFILIFGLVYGNNEAPSLKVGLAVSDSGPGATPVATAIKSVPIFKITEGNFSDLETNMKNGDLSAVIEIPNGFSTNIPKSDALVVVLTSPANQSTNSLIVSMLGEVIAHVNQAITGTANPIAVQQQSIDTTTTSQIDWLVPGILGMSIMQLGLFASAAFVTLREKKVFRRFAVTPVKRHHLLISQVLFRLMFGIIQSVVLLAVGYLVYHVTIQGNLLLLFGVVCLSVMMFLAMGYIIASLAKNEEVVEPLVQVFAMPMMFLSGVFFPIDLMPEFIRPVVRALPLTYLNDALRAIVNNGSGLLAIGNDLLVMTGWLVSSMLVAIKVFRWE